MSATKSIKFNAGKVQYDENSHRCTPLAHKGVISIKANAEEPELFDFVWSPKGDVTVAGNVPEKETLLLMPGDVSFKHIKSCSTGRVFALTFFSSGAKYLYWLQDVGDIDQADQLTQKDINLAKSVNELISVKFDDEEEEDEEEELEPEQETKEIKEQQDNEEPKPEETTAQTNNTAISPNNQIKFELPISSISDFLNLETIQKHLEGLDHNQIKELYGEYIPESGDLLSVIRSGFFQQSEQRLTESLASGNGSGYLLAQSLKYDYKGEGINNFLHGIRELGQKEKQEETKQGDGDGDDDEDEVENDSKDDVLMKE